MLNLLAPLAYKGLSVRDTDGNKDNHPCFRELIVRWGGRTMNTCDIS